MRAAVAPLRDETLVDGYSPFEEPFGYGRAELGVGVVLSR